MSFERDPQISEAEPSMWKCGDAYQYPLPKPEGNPWDVVLEPYLKRDKIQCDAWKDEVQTLLIFAGLFSAVVTAFVVQSYQTLQPNPNDTAFLLLARIADRLDNATLPSSTTPPTFRPSASSIRVNILWFFSLILSLTTVLVGIVALQWLREHQRYTDAIKPKEALAVYRMRAVALEKWYVPQVFTGLPLLLQGGLILFFAGAVDFLFALDATVAIPVTLVVVLTLLFLIATTVLPTLQCFLLALFRPSTKPSRLPVQCPYKSPQSWAFHRLVTWIFSQAAGSLEIVIPPSIRPSPWNLRFLSFRFGIIGDPETWIKFDSGWLKIRDVYSQYIHGVFTPTADSVDPRRPTYDEAEILLSTVQEYSDDPDILFAAYHCFHEVSQNALHREHSLITQQSKVRHDILRRYYWNRLKASSNSPISSLLCDSEPEFLHEENMLFFLWLPEADFPQISVHFLELQSRMMGYAFTNTRQIASLQSITLKYSNCHQWFEMMQMCEEYDMTQMGKFELIRAGMNSGDSEDTDSIPRSMVDTTVEQFFMMFSAFIQTAASVEDEHVMGTIYGHTILRDFLQIPAFLHQYVSSTSGSILSSRVQSVFQSSLVDIASTLEKSLTGNESQRTDFLFICTCLFLERLLTFYPFYSNPPEDDDDDSTETKFLPLVKAMARYEKTVDGTRIAELFGYLCASTKLPYHEAQLNRKTYIPLYAFPQWLRNAVIEEFQGSVLLLEYHQPDENLAREPVLVLEDKKRGDSDDMDDIKISVAGPDDNVGNLIDINNDTDSQELKGDDLAQTYLSTLPFIVPAAHFGNGDGPGTAPTYNPHAEQVV